MAEEHDTCAHDWRSMMVVQSADYFSDKRISRVYWVRIWGCPKCGTTREEVLREEPLSWQRRNMLGLGDAPA